MPELHPVDPIEIKLADGVSRQLRFSNGSLKRLRKRFGFKSTRELFEMEMSESVSAFLLEGFVDKGDLTEEAIDEMIHPSQIQDLYAAVVSGMSGEPLDKVKNGLRRAARRALGLAAEEEATETSTGYVNGLSVDTSESDQMSSGDSQEPKPQPS